MTEGPAGARLKLLAFLVLLMFSALTVRLWYLQVLASEQFVREANENRLRFIEFPATRGRILDANGQILVGNRLSRVVTVNEDELGASAESVLARLAEVLGLRPGRITRALKDPRYYDYQPVPVAVDVEERVTSAIKEHDSLFPGVDTEEVPVRTYPQGRLAAHLLGYTGQITADEYDKLRNKGYDANDQIGQAGLESVYERWLRGEKGVVKYQVNAAGENLVELGRQEDVPGHDLVLSLDADIQNVATESLRLGMDAAREAPDEDSNELLKATAGAVVVMDPNSGAIKAMASLPDFSPKVYISGDRGRLAKLEGSDRAPLFDRATQAGYPPGSTFKPFVALAALRNGIASLGGSYECPATFQHEGDTSNTVFPNWTTSNLGFMSVAEALTKSCDTVFYRWGDEFWYRYAYSDANGNRDYAGTEPLQRDLRQFGFGRPTGIDVPTETSGVIPDDAWIREQHKADPKLFEFEFLLPGQYINMAIGQGYVTASPLQLATAYSMIANGGRCVVPHLADHVQTAKGNRAGVRSFQPRCSPERRELPYSSQQIDLIKQGLEGVVHPGGTASSAFGGFGFSQVSVAGKTGTAQVKPFQDYSWFAAMAPVADPKYVVVAVIEQGGHGSTTAAPVVRRILEHLYDLPTTEEITAEVATD